MPDLFYLVRKWWKQIAAFVVICVLLVAAVLFFKPSKYLSVATALPASSYATDKASVFNQNIQILYSAMGTPDDLDMIVGTAHLDTVYISVAKQYDLAARYKLKEQGDAAIRKAASRLRSNSKVMKSEFSELKVKVWDVDRLLAPELANAIMNKLQSIHQDLQNTNNILLIKSLQGGKEKLVTQMIDTAGAPDRSSQIGQYDKLINEYQLLVDNKTPVLITVEPARVTDWPDKPKRLPILAATVVLSLLFGLLLALLLEKRKDL
ncbi:MAG: hypothetical protein H7Y42_02095 [Chitinophagaceae bacterium]|nr:hypothetical protein [Chitinophagaceae bacterium]